MPKPLAIDLFCGLGGWAHSLLAEGWDVIGFDTERHRYPKIAQRGGESVKRPGMSWSGSDQPGYKAVAFNATTDIEFESSIEEYPGQLVLQDVLTLHGSQFKNAALIVASPPCQAYSYRAMPWKRAKALPPPSNELFEACFRIQREASEAAGRYIPLVVENVKGAQPWVGRAKAHFGSFYLWGDVEGVGAAITGPKPKFGELLRAKTRGAKFNPDGTEHGQGSWKVPGFNFHAHEKGEKGGSFQSASVDSIKNNGGSWFAIGSPGQKEVGQNPDGRKVPVYSDPRRNGGKGARLTSPEENLRRLDGAKNGNDWFGSGKDCSLQRRASSKSSARKAASAQIAKIPEPLALHIARVFKP